jgi:hypothetical protein
MIENVNETAQNLDVLQNMAQNIEKVDDSDDFYYEDPVDYNDFSNDMIYSTKPADESVQVPEMPDFFAQAVAPQPEQVSFDENKNVPYIEPIMDINQTDENQVNESSNPVEINLNPTENMQSEQIQEPVQEPSIDYTVEYKEKPSIEKSELEKVEETIPEVKNFQLTDKEKEKIEEASSSVKDVDLKNFDAVFASLSSDVNGANNFISNLIEQRKSVNTNEAKLIEGQEKLDKDKEEFAKFVETQKEAIELEKEQCKEYVRTQKIRIANEEAQFNSDVEATRAELALSEQTIKIGNEKLADEKQQFSSYKELEEEKLKADRQKLETEKTAFAKEKAITEEKQKTERLKLETEKEQFMKEKALNEDKHEADKQTLETEREQFEKEKKIEEEKIKNAQAELRKQEEQFAKYKELEEKKLELESKNLSQSCTRFKELVSQFNSGFQQLPGDKE